MAQYKGAASEAGRALHLQKKREKQQMEIEFRRKKIEEDLKLSNIETKFAAHHDAVDQLKGSSGGLVTFEEMKANQDLVMKEREEKLSRKKLEKEESKLRELEAKQAIKDRQKSQIQALSFSMDGEETDDSDDDENVSAIADQPEKRECDEEDEKIKKKIKKNPDVDTSFLPDREREEEEIKLREELKEEWTARQNNLKEEGIEITFSYWDGSGHRKTIKMKKGNTIYHFLQKSLEMLRKEFSELKTVTADQLMYVKEDLILPHHYSFYDFIVTKARGKSGPLFTFDVHDDIRIISDANIEKDESHAGKVLLRNWYERNKHIFPASRWEPYDPTKSYEKYTIKDKVAKK